MEDNPYGDLRYDRPALPNLLAFEGGFSRITHHASRLHHHIIYAAPSPESRCPACAGWIIADRQVIDKLVQAKQAADLHTPTLGQYLALNS